MQILTYTAETSALPSASFMFLAVIVHGTDFHPVTPFRSNLSAADAEAKAQAWWDSEVDRAAASEAGKAARAAAMTRARKKADAPAEPHIEEAF